MDNTEYNLKETIESISNGDQAAFRELYDIYKQKIFSICYSILRDSHLAEEAVQDSFIKIYNKISSYDKTKNFESWISRIAVNSSLDIQRRVKRNRKILMQEHEMNSIFYSSDSSHDKLDKVWDVLDKIPSEYRIPLILRDIQGLSGEEAAQALNVKHETLRWRLHKARQLFKDIWGQT
ncbi:MAG: RNA polymerase sigma factor [Planctomycetes bacterium]|nr:RNA polymerase sigma factor [Planctomycetota bacterium]